MNEFTHSLGYYSIYNALINTGACQINKAFCIFQMYVQYIFLECTIGILPKKLK